MKDANSDKHLTYFKVEGFKCFNSLELEDIGSINIITGDNNVGKSSLLEALLFDEDVYSFNEDLGIILLDRGFSFREKGTSTENYIKHFINTTSAIKELLFTSKIKKLPDTLITQHIAISPYSTTKKTEDIEKTRVLVTRDNSIITSLSNPTHTKEISIVDEMPYISDQYLFEELVEFYGNTLQKDSSLKGLFISYLTTFGINAVNIEPRIDKDNFKEPYLIINTKDSSLPIPLNQYGQGTVKMLKLFMAIIAFRGHRLMLDEVDNGIHFSRLKDYFKRMILLAKENNTQLFISTHSKECLNAIKEAFESPELIAYQNEFRNYKLAPDKNNRVTAFKYDYSNFKIAIEGDNNIRGGE